MALSSRVRRHGTPLSTTHRFSQESNPLPLAQGVQAEDQVRRNSRVQLGKEIAAFGSAGVGYGGSSEDALRTSTVNQEMDALNTRYKAQLAGYGYGVRLALTKRRARRSRATLNSWPGESC